MLYLIWSLPLVAVAGLMASGRVGSVGAGLCGVLTAIAVAATAAPVLLSFSGVLLAGVKGLWLSWLVAAVILAGLFFRDIVSGDGDRIETAPADAMAERRRVFAACFLVGPFAEAATGFGVGQVATIAMLRSVGLPPLRIVVLGLFSQMLVSWGAMANGTIVGAELAGLSAMDLGLHSALLSVPLLLAWLVMFWRIAATAGLPATAANAVSELAWVLCAAVLLVLANHLFGPEIAAMAALGPLIVLRFWRDETPDRKRWRIALRIGLPYAALIVGLAATRGIPALTSGLGHVASVRPFADGPTWLPLLHPGTWLVIVGCLAALVGGHAGTILPAAERAWRHGRQAVLTIAVYLVIARVMADSGTAEALAQGLRQLLGTSAALATPLLAGAFGFLTGSSNAANGLLMPSQASLAIEGRPPLAWIAATQNTASAALTMLSPARVAMGCALVGRPDLERATYEQAWPLGAVAVIVLTAAIAVLLIVS